MSNNYNQIDHTQAGRYILFSKIKNILKPIEKSEYYEPTGLLAFFFRHCPHDPSVYSFFGIFCFISSVSTIFFTQMGLIGPHSQVILVLYEIMLITASVFMLYMMWSSRVAHPVGVSVLWNIVLFMVLSFASSFFVFYSDFSQVQIVIYTFNIFVLMLLTRWKMSLFMIFSGYALSNYYYNWLTGTSGFHLLFEYIVSNFIYVALLISTSLVVLFKPEESVMDVTESRMSELHMKILHFNPQDDVKNNEIVDNILNSVDISENGFEKEELIRIFHGIIFKINSKFNMPISRTKDFTKTFLQNLQDHGISYIDSLYQDLCFADKNDKTLLLNAFDLAFSNPESIILTKQLVNLSEITEERIKIFYNTNLNNKNLSYEIRLSPELFVNCDPDFIRQVIDNLLYNASYFSKNSSINISIINNREGGAEFIIKDNGLGVPKNEIYNVFTPLKLESNIVPLNHGRRNGLSLCRSILEAHGGMIRVTSDGENGASFSFALPLIMGKRR